MAPISKLISFLFLTTLLFSLQINARDSQFFSKVTHVNNNNNNNNKDNNVRETEVPNNEKPVNKPEQQPVFIPETENSYGLYGHESGLNPPTTTTNTYRPYKTTSEEDNTKNPNNNYYNFQKDAYSTKYPNEIGDTRLSGTSSFSSSSSNNNNNNYFYNNNKDADAYGVKQNELSDTKFTEGGYNPMENQNDKKKYYYNNNNNNNAVNDKYYFNNNNAAPSDRYFFKNKAATTRNNYNGESERLGMSDTRFMEGGKYFYNVNSEKYNNYNPTTVNEGSSKGVNSENWYNNRGYFGSNVNNVNKNSMGGYQNQEEFEDDQEDFEP